MNQKELTIQELCHFRNDKELKTFCRSALKYTAFVAKTYSKVHS